MEGGGEVDVCGKLKKHKSKYKKNLELVPPYR
jgi:hypothetical protein